MSTWTVKQNTEIITKLSETEIKLFQLPNEFGNHFETISAALNMSENIREQQCSWEIIAEIISGKFPRAEIKLFQTDVDEAWNDFISHVTTVLYIYTQLFQ